MASERGEKEIRPHFLHARERIGVTFQHRRISRKAVCNKGLRRSRATDTGPRVSCLTLARSPRRHFGRTHSTDVWWGAPRPRQAPDFRALGGQITMHIGKRSAERVEEPDRPLLISWCRDAGEMPNKLIREQPADPFLTRALPSSDQQGRSLLSLSAHLSLRDNDGSSHPDWVMHYTGVIETTRRCES
jgi:hypothetical protein